jgi:hypothetical protein
MKMDTYNKAMSESQNDNPLSNGSLINFQNLISQAPVTIFGTQFYRIHQQVNRNLG